MSYEVFLLAKRFYLYNANYVENNSSAFRPKSTFADSFQTKLAKESGLKK